MKWHFHGDHNSVWFSQSELCQAIESKHMPAESLVLTLSNQAKPRRVSRIVASELSLFLFAYLVHLAIYSIRLTPACFHGAVIPGLLLLLDGTVRRPGFWRSARAGTVYGLLAYSLPSFLASIDEAGFDRRLLWQGLNYMLKHPLQTAERSFTRALLHVWVGVGSN